MTHDPVNHPSHYRAEGIEAIDVIEAFNLCFRLGNVVKYVLRAGRKIPGRYTDPDGVTIEDLKKARWYLDREIARREGMYSSSPSKPTVTDESDAP